MGVTGLLQSLTSVTRDAAVSKYSGKRVAVDAYCILHRGAYAAPMEVVEEGDFSK